MVNFEPVFLNINFVLRKGPKTGALPKSPFGL